MLKTTSVNGAFGDARTMWIWFGSIFVLGILARLASTTGLIASDDLWYSRYAQLITEYLYVPELHHYAIRYGLTIPVAGIYWLFGVSEWTTVLVPLLASVVSVPVLMLIAWKLFGPRPALIAGVLFATFPVQLRYATMLVPEPVAEFYVLVAVLAYLIAEERNSLLVSAAAGICLGIAYLTKEPALFVAPALMIDAWARGQRRLVMGIALGVATIVATEHVYYLAQTGDLLFRSHAMVIHNQSQMALAANQDLYYRLVKGYPRMMLLPNTDFGLHSLVSLTLVLPGLVFLDVNRSRLLILWALLPWLYLNFGSSNISHYFALPVADRYIEFFYPPLFLLVGAVADQYVSAGKGIARLLFVTILLVAASGFSCAFFQRGQGWRTDEVITLRLIAKRAENLHVNQVRFVGDRSDIWKQTMAILAPDIQISSNPRKATIIVQPDKFGLPFVVRALDDVSSEGSSE